MTTTQKMQRLLGKTVFLYDRESHHLLDIVQVLTMNDAWEICSRPLKKENGHLVMYTAKLKYIFPDKRLASIA